MAADSLTAAQRVGAAGRQGHHDRRAGVQQRVQQRLLDPGQRRRRGVAALAAGAASEEPGAVAQGQYDEVRAAGEVHRLGETTGVGAVHRGRVLEVASSARRAGPAVSGAPPAAGLGECVPGAVGRTGCVGQALAPAPHRARRDAAGFRSQLIVFARALSCPSI